jgi:hypothetical protein
MAIPVITLPDSPRRIAQGVAITITLAASGTPTSWAASGLPSGLSINTTTGVISGTPLTQQLTTANITATNGDGTSEAVSIIFVIESTPPGAGGPFDIELDFDALTGIVSVPGIDRVEGQPLFHAPRGTNRYLLVGITKRGVLQDVNPDEEDVTVRMGLKELEPERVLELTSGAASKQGSVADLTRYRIPFRITPSNWSGTLNDYEADAGTEVISLAELEVTVGEPAVLHDATLTDSGIEIEGGLNTFEEMIVGEHDFTGIEEFAVPTRMRLTLTLAVAGRPLQAAEFVRTFDLVFDDGAFVISNPSAPLFGVVNGATEGAQWKVGFELLQVTADANSVDVDYGIRTSNDGTQTTYDWIIDLDGVAGFAGDFSDPDATVSFSDSIVLELFDGSSSQLGVTETLATNPGSTTDFLAHVRAKWNLAIGSTQLPVGAVTVVDATTIKIAAPSTTSVRKIGFEDSDPADPLLDPDAIPNVEGEATTCSVTARLEQLEGPADVPLNLTSRQFLVAVPRDIVPD